MSTSEKSLKFLECLPRGEWLTVRQLRTCASKAMINPDLVLRRVSVLLRQGLLERRWMFGPGEHYQYRVVDDFQDAKP